MRIGIFRLSKNFDGVEHVVYYLAKELIKLGVEVVLLINKEMVRYYKDIKKLRIINLGKLSTKNMFSMQYSYYKVWKNIKNILYREEFDLVYFMSHPPIMINYLLFKDLKSNFVIILHGKEIRDFINSKNIFYKTIVKPKVSLIFEKSKIIVSVSLHQIQNFPKKYKQKTIVIPNGVDLKIFKPLKNVKQKNNVILFAGRFIEIKGIKEILKVAKQLPQYEFWFAGQGELSNLINLPNTKNLGFKTTEELVKLYNQATICIFPSWHESFGLVGLEAMSCSRSVIATPFGFSEYIKNKKDGIIIPTKDEKALKNAVVDLMKNPKKRKMMEKNARKKALKYSWGKVAKRYTHLNKHILTQK